MGRRRRRRARGAEEREERGGETAAGNPQAVPTDGVFVLDRSRDYDGDASNTFAAISVDVSVDGMPVGGALESVGLAETMIWRPAAPLIAGAAPRRASSETSVATT